MNSTTAAADDVPLQASRMHRLPLTATAIAMFAVMAILGIWLRPLMPIDETRYMTVAWEMRNHGDWIVPHLNGEIYSHKPPLLFWLINLVWTFTGTSEFAARLIGPAFAAGTIFATSRLARALYPDRPELVGYAAMALAGMLGFAFFGGLTMFDAMLAFATVCGVLSLVHAARAQDKPRGWLPWVFYGASIALGVISKGPVILVHLLPVAVAMPWWAGLSPRRTLTGIGIGIGTALVLIALWLLPAIILGGAEYRDEILWKQSAGRMVESFAHLKPWWFFLPILPLLTWPWSWSIAFWREIRLRTPLIVWIVATVVIFSLISGKQTHYLVPMLPAVAVLAALGIASMAGLWAPIAAAIPVVAGLYLLGLTFGLVKGEARDVLGPWPLDLVVALALFGIAVIAVIWRGWRIAVLSPLFITVLNLIFLGNAGGVYDAGLIGGMLKTHDQAGVATLDDGYAGEFGFAGRLDNPVQMLGSVAEGESWLGAAAGRILMGRMDRDLPKAAPEQVINFRGRDYGFWTAPPLLPATGVAQ